MYSILYMFILDDGDAKHRAGPAQRRDVEGPIRLCPGKYNLCMFVYIHI